MVNFHDRENCHTFLLVRHKPRARTFMRSKTKKARRQKACVEFTKRGATPQTRPRFRGSSERAPREAAHRPRRGAGGAVPPLITTEQTLQKHCVDKCPGRMMHGAARYRFGFPGCRAQHTTCLLTRHRFLSDFRPSHQTSQYPYVVQLWKSRRGLANPTDWRSAGTSSQKETWIDLGDRPRNALV